MSSIICGAALSVGCSLVDDDLSTCDNEFQLDYQLCLVTNITTELETELSFLTDKEIQGKLKDYLKGIFTDYAKDVNLSFYDNEPPQSRLKHLTETMNGSESSYTLFLPVRTYLHTALANIKDNQSVTLEDDEYCKTARLVQHTMDGVVQPHNTGLFTAREDIQVVSGIDQHFDVRLYMSNAATALVMDLSETAGLVQEVNVMVSGFATEYRIYSNEFVYAPEGEDPLVATSRLDTSSDGQQACFVSVHFPSRPASEQSKVVVEVDDGAKTSADPLWEWIIHAKLTDGTITESVLQMHEELQEGHIKVLKATLRDNGVAMVEDPTVGISVTLDWNDAGDYDVDF